MDERYTILMSDFHRHGGGHCVYVHTLAKHVLKLGHRPLVACPHRSQLAIDCESDGIEVLDEFRFDAGFTPISFCRDIALIEHVKAKNKIDVIHVNGSRDHWEMATANLLSKKKVPIVRTRQNTKPVKNNLLNRFLNQKLTDHTITPCAYVKDMYADSPVFRNCEITVIHHGVEMDKFAPHPPDERLRSEIGLSADNIVIGILGRLDWDKGHKYLFEAIAPLIKGEFPHIRVLVVGFGTEDENLRTMCERLGISRNVVFLGWRSDVGEVISLFDIGVHPSIGVDTSSYAMKEMMAMEKPIVCSSYGGLREIADDGLTGYVVPPRDSDGLRGRILDLCRSGELREKMGREGRKKVEREFTSKLSAQRTLEIYKQAIEAREGKRNA